MDDFHRLREKRLALAKVRRDALPYCIDGHHPPIATEDGLERMRAADRMMAPSYGKHEKVKPALQLRAIAPILSLVGAARHRERERACTTIVPHGAESIWLKAHFSRSNGYLPMIESCYVHRPLDRDLPHP